MRSLVMLFQTISAFLVLFYLYCESPAFQPLSSDWARPRGRVRLFLVFTGITILGNYLGTPVLKGGAIINARAVGSVLAGLLGGPVLGGLVGATAGAHRMSLGGIAALSGAVATTLEGVLAGLLNRRLRDRPEVLITMRTALLATFAGEVIHMGIVLLLTRPFPEAVEIVKVIAPPMVFLNPVGAALLMAVLMHRQRDLDRVAAASSAAALRVAERALGLLGRGFGPDTAGEMAAIVKEETGVGAVAVTDNEKVLGFVGLGSDHHRPGSAISSAITRQAIQDRAVVFADGVHQVFECGVSGDCPLHSALVVPLEVDGTVLGTVQLFEPKNRRFLHMNRRLGEGIGALLSSQLLIAKYQEQKNLLVLSELRLLRAQVNPHFLFNSLNTIMAILRNDAVRGRELVGHLSGYFRKNLQRHGELSTLDEELEHIRAYLEIEKARFEGLQVEIDVATAFRAVKVPTFTLQPLLENAIRHGVSRMPGPGTVRILAFAERGALRIDVEDDAGAFDEGRRSREGLGLRIVQKRLASLFGPGAGPEIHCEPGSLTRMTIRVPLEGALVE